MIKFAFFDIDGVLTDGMVYVDSQGNETKRISFEDIDAIFELKRAGIKIGFITGEENGFSEYVKKRFIPDYFVSGCKDKLSYFIKLAKKEKIGKQSACFVGDSNKDVPLLEYLYNSFVPSNVGEDIKRSARFIVNAKKGEGVIREVAQYILKK